MATQLPPQHSCVDAGFAHTIELTPGTTGRCKLLDPVWEQTAEQLPDQAFAADVRMAKVDCESPTFCHAAGHIIGALLPRE